LTPSGKPGSPLALRVEIADGRLLWESADGYGRGERVASAIRVTPAGYVIVTPNVTGPAFESIPRESGGVRAPLVFDSTGQLVAELSVLAKRGMFFDAISPDGQYYAINFCNTDVETDAWCIGASAEGGWRGLNCLAVFDLSTGRELWQRCFGGCGYGRVAVGPGARVIVSAAQEGEARVGTRGSGEVLYFFDRNGNTLRTRQLFDAARNLKLSSNGKFAVLSSYGDAVRRLEVQTQARPDGTVHTASISVRNDSLFVFNTETGVLAYSYVSRPGAGCHVYDVHVGADGDVLVVTGCALEESGDGPGIVTSLIGPRGSIEWERSWDSRAFPLTKYGFSNDGRQVIEVSASAIQKYIRRSMR
jgi:hypothetical protein